MSPPETDPTKTALERLLFKTFRLAHQFRLPGHVFKVAVDKTVPPFTVITVALSMPDIIAGVEHSKNHVLVTFANPKP